MNEDKKSDMEKGEEKHILSTGWNSHYQRISTKIDFEFFREYDKRSPYIKRMLKFAEGKKRSLEFGSGKGGLSLVLKRNYPSLEIHLLDLEEKAIEFSKKLFQYYSCEATFYRNSFLKLPFPDEYFDFIHGNTALEHVKDTEKAVKELTRVLAKGGNILITVPNSFRQFDGHDLYHTINRFQYFSRTFYPKELENLLANNSCETVDRFGIGFIYHYPSYMPRYLYEKLKSRSANKLSSRVKLSTLSDESMPTVEDEQSVFTIREKNFYKIFSYADRIWDPIQRKINHFTNVNEIFPFSWYITIGIVAKKL
ncbi:MAG: class I SAM-dependent methyltransferase [Nitrosopumilaceae archaeon]